MVKDEKSIKTTRFYIKGNIMTWDEHMLQLSNVSFISTSNVAALPFPVWTLVLLLGGLFVIPVSLLAGLLSMLLGGVFIFLWYKQNQKRLSTTNLNIGMNSGSYFCISFTDKVFLENVLSVLENIIRDGGIGNNVISVDIKDCKIGGDVDILNKSNVG